MTNKKPESWLQLQDFVKNYFVFAGYEAISPYVIETVRSTVEVDVYVKAERELGKLIICECKFWDKHIPQETIHSFRTVVIDSGASLGIIISKKGFQRGAYLAAEKSNIMLYNWEEFLESIHDKWFEYRKKRLYKLSRPLSVYTDPFDVPLEDLTKEERDEYNLSIVEYTGLYFLTCRIGDSTIKEYKDKIDQKVETEEDFFESAELKLEEVTKYYEALFSKVCLPEWKFAVH